MNIKKRIVFLLILCILFTCFTGFASTSTKDNKPISIQDAKELAYMHLEDAPYELHEKILEARNIIINNSPGWVADGWYGGVFNVKTGEIIRILPQFYDLFPEDWDMPVDSEKDIDEKVSYSENEPFVRLPDGLSVR